MKLVILISITVFGTIGGALGNILDHQSPFNLLYFGGWSIVVGTIGSFFGVWAGYKAGQYLGL